MAITVDEETMHHVHVRPTCPWKDYDTSQYCEGTSYVNKYETRALLWYDVHVLEYGYIGTYLSSGCAPLVP